MRKRRCFFIFIGLMIGFSACFFLFLVWQAREDRLQQTLKAQEFIEASYAGDIDAVLALFPNSLYERLVSDTIELTGSAEDVPGFVGSRLCTCIETIETLFGEGWKYSFEITGRHEYTGKERKDLNDCYEMMGIADAGFRQASILTVEVRISGVNGTEGRQTILVPLVKERGQWGIGQQIGSAYETLDAGAGYDLYGNLLDGFSYVYDAGEELPGETGGEAADANPASEETVNGIAVDTMAEGKDR